MRPKLEIELVPSTCFFTNLQSILDNADWDTLRKKILKNADYKCEICGEKGEELHEVFEYEEIYADDIPEPMRIQKLSHCQKICFLCHEAKHFGIAQVKGNGERAKETLMRVNGWDDKQTEKYVREKFSEWHKRSRYKWILDIKKMSDYKIDMTKYIDKLKP